MIWVTRLMDYSSYDVTNGPTVDYQLERACLGPSLFAALDYIVISKHEYFSYF